MDSIYVILENLVIFMSKDVVYKIIVPLILVFLIFDIIRYLFSKDSKREDILDSLKSKAIGFVVLIFLPFIMLWFINFLGEITGAPVDVDTSILDKLTGSIKPGAPS